MKKNFVLRVKNLIEKYRTKNPFKICERAGIEIIFQDLGEIKGFHVRNAGFSLIIINNKLSELMIIIVLLHELGHLEHIGAIYRHSSIRCENEANRHMIHKLLEEELASSDDHQSFNFLHFMQKHKLKTVTDETMVKEEYLALLN